MVVWHETWFSLTHERWTCIDASTSPLRAGPLGSHWYDHIGLLQALCGPRATLTRQNIEWCEPYDDSPEAIKAAQESLDIHAGLVRVGVRVLD